jgi:hypothetical protein
MRLNRRAIVVLAVLTGLAVAAIVIASNRPHRGVAAPGPRALPPPTVESFGVNVNRLFNDFSFSQSQIDRQLAALQATGATLARSDALWEASEPRAPVDGVHHFDWSFDDWIAGSLAAHGLRWLPIIDYSAAWARSILGVDHSPPSSSADYAAYAAAFTRRYGSGGAFWLAHPRLRPLPVSTLDLDAAALGGRLREALHRRTRRDQVGRSAGTGARRRPHRAGHVPPRDAGSAAGAAHADRRRRDPPLWRRPGGSAERCQRGSLRA